MCMFVCIRRDEAAQRPKTEFVPKTLADLHVETGLEEINGESVFHVGLSDTNNWTNSSFRPFRKFPQQSGQLEGGGF